MAKQILRLNTLKLNALKAEGMHPDGNGLYLRVTASATKSWVLRYKRAGKSRDMGLGTYPSIGLAKARGLAEDARVLLQQGLDPIEERKAKEAPPPPPSAPKIVTFDDAARQYIAAHEAGWRNAKHRQQWANTLRTYAGPIIGSKDVAGVSQDDVLRILEPIWRTKPETASRVRGRIENVLDWAKARKLRQGENPGMWKGGLKHLLPARKKLETVRHHPALPWREIPEFMTELRANTCLSALALQFIVLTCARTSEAIEAQWTEIDAAQCLWVVPSRRMKGNREHRVALSGPAIAVLAKLPRVDGNPYLFPGARTNRPLSNMAALELLRGMRPGLTVHGFRSSFRDWVSDATNHPRELAESALAHLIGGPVERAYARGDLFEKRTRLMADWADFCTNGARAGGQVIPMRSNA